MSLAQESANAYLAVSDLDVAIGEKAWLLVRFMPANSMRMTEDLNRVECDARAKGRHDGSVCPLSYAPTRASSHFCWGATPLVHISRIFVTQICTFPRWLVNELEDGEASKKVSMMSSAYNKAVFRQR
jgi:hypothetical protein